ncbi:MAG: cytochrome c oxidase assembly protein [Stenotrophobium sp.]
MLAQLLPWDYYAEHRLFVHRLQHFALHDVGPCLLAFSSPGTILTAWSQ